MKKLLVLLIALLTIAPACRKKAVKPAVKGTPVEIKEEKKGTTEATKVAKKEKEESLFLDEAVDQFSLKEEEGAGNAFAPSVIKEESEISVVKEEEAADKAADAKQRAEQAKYGLKTIYFDFDKFDLRSDQYDALERDLEAIKQVTGEGKAVVIEGHACKVGSDAYNVILSEKRAQNVKKWLVKKGVVADKLKVVGRGNEMCIVEDGTREEQWPNRRVVFIVMA